MLIAGRFVKIVRALVAVTLSAMSFLSCANDFSKTFVPSPGVVAVVKINGPNLIWRLSGRRGINHGEVGFDTEKPLDITIGSYDFSGRLGFWVSHTDDGMGTFQIDRVFVFSPSANRFVERFPACADGFYNLRVDNKRRLLVSAYWERNALKTCVTRLLIKK